MKTCVAFLLVVCFVQCASAMRCIYGTEPGHWTNFQWAERPSSGKTLDYNRLDDTPESVWLQTSLEPTEVPFGSAYQVFSETCKLKNILQKFWTENYVERRLIVFVGDSVDAQVLDFLCETYHYKGFKGWKAYVHSHHVINYCILPSGLTVLQIYLLRSSHHEDHLKMKVLDEFFNYQNDTFSNLHFDGTDRSALIGRADEVKEIMNQKPDLMIFSSNYWSLHHFVSQHDQEMTPHLLPESYVMHYIDTTSDLIKTARAAFPATRLAVHTSIEIRTSCEHGNNVDGSNKRIWGKRAYVAQLNAALRFISREVGVELVDYETISKAFQPSQLTADDVHPRSFFSLEMLNLYLNVIRAV